MPLSKRNRIATAISIVAIGCAIGIYINGYTHRRHDGADDHNTCAFQAAQEISKARTRQLALPGYKVNVGNINTLQDSLDPSLDECLDNDLINDRLKEKLDQLNGE